VGVAPLRQELLRRAQPEQQAVSLRAQPARLAQRPEERPVWMRLLP